MRNMLLSAAAITKQHKISSEFECVIKQVDGQ
jgi:hypothetical protein